MDFLNQRFSIRFSSFILYLTVYGRVTQCGNCRGCVSLKKYRSQGKALKVTLNSKEETPQDFFLDFVQEFGLRAKSLNTITSSSETRF
jgi:hypothetical protein